MNALVNSGTKHVVSVGKALALPRTPEGPERSAPTPPEGLCLGAQACADSKALTGLAVGRTEPAQKRS